MSSVRLMDTPASMVTRDVSRKVVDTAHYEHETDMEMRDWLVFMERDIQASDRGA